MNDSGVFITGTDTGIGKTVLSSLLLSALEQSRIRANYFKPVQTGTDSDTRQVAFLTSRGLESFPKPAYEFPEPMAPERAAALHGTLIQLSSIQTAWRGLGRPDEKTFWVVEGAGGLLVPISPAATIRELCRSLKLPLLIAASTRLGSISHILLTLEAAQAAQLKTLGIVLFGDEDPELEFFLSQRISLPFIARIPRLNAVNPETVRSHALEYLHPHLEKILCPPL